MTFTKFFRRGFPGLIVATTAVIVLSTVVLAFSYTITRHQKTMVFTVRQLVVDGTFGLAAGERDLRPELLIYSRTNSQVPILINQCGKTGSTSGAWRCTGASSSLYSYIIRFTYRDSRGKQRIVTSSRFFW